MFIKNYNTFKKIHVDEGEICSDLPSSTTKHCFWYYGKTGTGKSHAAREDFPGAFLKVSNNKWWDGFNSNRHKFAIMDDFDKSHAYMGFHLKIWGDRYAFPAEVKGNTIRIRPEALIVTSNYHPKEIWPNEPATLDPILRRFKVVRFSSFLEALGMQQTEEVDEERQAYGVANA